MNTDSERAVRMETELGVGYDRQSKVSEEASPFSTTLLGSWRRLWDAWRHASVLLASFLGRVLLTVFYFTVVPPFAVLVRVASNPLSLRTHRKWGTPQWQPMKDKVIDWDAVRRQG